MTRRRLWLLAAVPVLTVAMVLTQLIPASGSNSAVALRGFNSCDELHQYYLHESLLRLKRDDVGIAYDEAEEEAFEEPQAEAAVDDAVSRETAAVSEPADEGEVSDTGTNVQERGVDESDIIKTDGEYIYVLRPQSLLIARINEGGPVTEVGRISFPQWAQRQELLIGAGKAVVVRQLQEAEAIIRLDLGDVVQPHWRPHTYRARSEVFEIGIGQNGSPRLLRELDLDGRFVSARLVGDNVRIVMQHYAWLPWGRIWDFSRSRGRHETYNNAIAEASKLGHWFPLFGFQDHENTAFDQGYAIDCTQTFAPQDGWESGLSFMLSFDLDAGMAERGSVAVMSDHPTVYASIDSLYLAAPARDWRNTTIHRFDIADPLEPTYFGSGSVRGQLLSQWAMSEHNGYLRVATTIWDRWPTVSNVFVLEAVEDEEREPTDPTGSLQQAGLVSGLGVTESIFAVRFAGDVGYVVTFRQVDPLYVLDLSDPTDPKAVGELKIPGFSRYLHPLSGGLLLGIGRDADPNTGRERGLQASLFDVSDPANPVQLSVLPLGDNARSPVEFDHRAFRYVNGVAWIPVGPAAYHLWENHDGAFLGVRVTDEGLSHESSLRVQGEARRAMPVGGQIHLLSREEIRTYSLEDYRDLGRLSLRRRVG